MTELVNGFVPAAASDCVPDAVVGVGRGEEHGRVALIRLEASDHAGELGLEDLVEDLGGSGYGKGVVHGRTG